MIFEVLINHIKDNFKIYAFLVCAFLIGLFTGAFTVNGLAPFQLEELNNYFQNFLQLMDNQKINATELLKISFIDNIKIVLILWLLGVSIIGIPLIFIVIGIRGFITGFSSGFIIKTLGFKGALFNFFVLIPKELITIPCIIILGVNGIKFSLDIIKNRSIKHISKKTLKNNFITYCIISLFFLLIILLGSLLEAYIVPVFMNWLAPYLRK